MPCQRIAPVFERLASKYAQAVFLKVDVDRCQETAAAQGVSVMPTFIFYKNRVSMKVLEILIQCLNSYLIRLLCCYKFNFYFILYMKVGLICLYFSGDMVRLFQF